MAEAGKFGACCEALKDVLGNEDFEPLVAVDDSGVLYMSVGMLDADSDKANMVDHPIYFCPFCGTKLQTEEEVETKTNAAAA